MLNKEEQDYVLKDYTRTDIDLAETDALGAMHDAETLYCKDGEAAIDILAGIVNRLMDIQDYPKDEVTE